MIIVRAPLRVSFFGGGTDFREFHVAHGGAVLTTSIDAYVHVFLNARFDQRIRVGYTRIELVDHVDEIEHDLVREALRKTGLGEGLEIVTMADIPAAGTGLGSSSTVTVGLLHALYTHLGQPKSPEELARGACEIEIDRLGQPIGVQDQYIAAYGGLRLLRFHPGGRVEVEPVNLDEPALRRVAGSLMLFFTRVSRRSETILAEQRQNIDARVDGLRSLAALAVSGRDKLVAGEVEGFGRLLDEGWILKKDLASRITNPEIDALYAAGIAAGAWGGKITGAGGGGFLLLACPEARQPAVREALRGLPELRVGLSPHGSRVLVDDRHPMR